MTPIGQALLALCEHLICIFVKEFSPPLRPLYMLPRMHGCKSMASSIAHHSSRINGKCAAFILRFFFGTFTHCVIHPFTRTFIPWWPRLPRKVPPAHHKQHLRVQCLAQGHCQSWGIDPATPDSWVPCATNRSDDSACGDPHFLWLKKNKTKADVSRILQVLQGRKRKRK